MGRAQRNPSSSAPREMPMMGFAALYPSYTLAIVGRLGQDRAMSRKSTAPPPAPRLPLDEPPVRPSFRRERAAIKRGVFPVAGCDEAGRGPLAGPVVAAAVILDPKRIPRGLNDSKKLTAAEREKLYQRICATAEVGVAF